MTDFPDKKEVDATRKWYYGIGWDLLAVILSVIITGIALIWILFHG